MAKNLDVGVKYTGDAKDFKQASAEARREAARLRKEAVENSQEMERKFKAVTMAVAKIGAGFLVAQQAFKVFSAAMNTTEGSSDRLEASIAYLKGGMQGFVESIVTDNLKSMSDLMKEAASAARTLAIELDNLADIQAGGKLKGGFLNERLQTLRVQIAGTTNPTQRASLIQEAINVSKEIAATEIDIKQDEITAYVRYYATRLGIDEKYFKEFQSLVTTVAKDWRYYDSEAFKATMESRINVLKNYTGSLTEGEAAELRRYENIKNFLEVIYNPAKDDLSAPGGWNDFVGLLTEIVNLSAAGEESVRRLTGQLTTASGKLPGGITPVSGISGAGAAGSPSLSQIEGMNKLVFATKDATAAMTDYYSITSQIEGTFANLFDAGIEGWDEFGKAAVQAIQAMLVKLAALAATYAVLSMIPGFSAFLEVMGGFKGFISQGMGWSTGNTGGSTMLKGRDIAIAGNRSMNVIMNNT